MLSLALVAAKPASEWPQRYNAGVTAYRTNDFTSAASAFEQATASTDRALQQRAFYNLGNASYRRGEADPTKAMPLWERALKGYESALAIDPSDADAKFNLDLVKKKIEEFKKQQEQQQEQQQQQQDKQKQDQNKDEKKDQQQQQPQNQPGQQQQQDQKQDQQQQKPEEKQKPEQEQGQQQQPQQQKGEKDQQQPQPQPGQTNNFEQIQARALLDNLREDERNWNFFPEVQMKDVKDSGEPEKDW